MIDGVPIFGAQRYAAFRFRDAWAMAGIVPHAEHRQRPQRIVVRAIVSGSEGDWFRRARRDQRADGIFQQDALFVEGKVPRISARSFPSGFDDPAAASHSVCM